MAMTSGGDETKRTVRSKRSFAKVALRERGSWSNNIWAVRDPIVHQDLILRSDVEYWHWLSLHADKDIVSFAIEPFEVLAEIDGKPRRSLPDCEVSFTDGRKEMREVKYASDFDNPRKKDDVLRQIEVQRLWCETNGYSHRVVTDTELRDRMTLLDNWRTILTDLASYEEVDLEPTKANVIKLLAAGSMTFGELLSQTPAHQRDIITASVYSLIRERLLEVDLESEPFSPRTFLRLANEQQ